jgi:hypothetical protein
VNIFGLLFTSDAHPRTKNNAPNQSTTGVAKTNSSHRAISTGMIAWKPGIIPPIAKTKTGSARPAAHQNFLPRAAASASPAEASGTPPEGSNAIPQRGQSPEPSFRTSGCIGHVHTAPAEASIFAFGRCLQQSIFLTPSACRALNERTFDALHNKILP